MKRKTITKIKPQPIDLLFLIFSFGEPITGIIRIDKMIQLIHELGRFPEVFLDREKTSKYSPFTVTLIEDLEALNELGLIRIIGSTYYPTPFIIDFRDMYNITPIQEFQINLVRSMVLHYDQNELLRFVYHERLPGEKRNVAKSLHTSKNTSEQTKVRKIRKPR